MNEKEKRVREERIREATRKGLTGLEGKFGTIIKYLGHPIIAEGGSFYESSYMDDPYELEEENDELPTMDEEQTIMELGYIFDGLSSGMHLEIKYLSERQELTVLYEGILVFSETASELTCYVPNPEWEEKIDSLYKLAKIRENKKRSEYMKENKLEAVREKQSLLDRLRLRWGV